MHDERSVEPGSPGSEDETRTSQGHDETIDGHRDPGLAGLPAHVGEYRVLGRLGEGGMGVVLEAEQRQPRRRVALKLIRGGALASSQTHAMFLREVETLARLKHPHIAAIYESGTAEDGQPFLVMELVSGEPLGRFASKCDAVLDRAELTLRLKLFRKICAAVHHAHQRGVIHRDLKPANIFVLPELLDGDGVPEIKILDFGLARIVDPEDGSSQRTETGVVKGTLSYMSPEQARGDADAIDTRTDVYALGVIVYELLSRERPRDFSSVSVVDALRSIAEQPVRRLREAWPPGSVRLDADLETIVHTALRGDVERRYSGADALAADIGRYLAHEPIVARAPSAAYQLKKFAQRNRALVGGAVATAVVLVAGIVASTTFGLREAAQRREVERARSDLEQVVAFQSKMLSDLDPESTGLRLLAAIRRELAEADDAIDASERREREALVDRLATHLNPADLARVVLDENILTPASVAASREFEGQPLTEARLSHTIGDTYRSLGLYEAAERAFRRAAALRAARLGENDAATLESETGIAVARFSRGEYDAARGRFEELRDLLAARLGADHQRTLFCRYMLASVHLMTGSYESAREQYEKLHAEQAEALGEEHEDTLDSLNGAAASNLRLGRFDEAAVQLREVVSARTRVLGRDDPRTLSSMTNLALALIELKRYDEAEALYVEALDRLTKTRGGAYPRTMRAMNNLGRLFSETGRPERAHELQMRALSSRRRTLGRTHPETLNSMNNVAVSLMSLGRLDEAESLLDELFKAVRETDPGASYLPLHLHSYAELMMLRGSLDRARTILIDVVEAYRVNDNANIGLALVQLAGVEARLGLGPSALDRLEEVVERGFSASIDPDDPHLAVLHGSPRFEEVLRRAREDPPS